jgi:2,3-bisphosphoglycerate-independent phosphoglycerate mutase
MARPELKGPLVLIILDGWGIRSQKKGNAIHMAGTPVMDSLREQYPSTVLHAAGEAVGLPAGQIGNSEVGHLNIGAGRIVYQNLVRINKAIEDGTFFRNEVILKTMEHVKDKGTALHLMGLLSDGGVHSHLDHLQSLLLMAHRFGLERVFVHAVLDGRDVPPTSAPGYLAKLGHYLEELGTGKIASLAGRYYAMDRDRRWERTKAAYDAYVKGRGLAAQSAQRGLEEAYKRGESDEFVRPTLIMEKGEPVSTISRGDAVLFYNFRADRMRQLLYSLYCREFQAFDRGDACPFPYLSTMTVYDAKVNIPVAFPPVTLQDSLGEVLSRQHWRQLRIAETEKYAHVTYFFNGGREKPFAGEDRILIPSPQVATYDLQPEMSAYTMTERVREELQKGIYRLVVLNYANADMVGHTGVLPAAVKAIEAVDRCLGRVISTVKEMEGGFIVTGDHGNAEQMLDENGSAHTAHTTSPVPFILGLSGHFHLRKEGMLADIAPTVLEILHMDQPEAMTGRSLLLALPGSGGTAVFSGSMSKNSSRR